MAKYIMTSDMFPENPDKWGRELSESVELQLLLMKFYLQGIASQSIQLEGEADFAGIPRLVDVSETDRKKLLREITINNTFLSLFRSLIIFVDKSLSLFLFSQETKKNPIGPFFKLSDVLDEIFEEIPTETYKKFSRDLSMTFPLKIEKLKFLKPMARDRLISYNQIRIAFEHHVGIPKHDIKLPLSKLEVKSKEPGLQEVIIQFDKLENKIFKKDEPIIFKSQEVSVIGFDIKGLIIKDIFLALAELDKD